MGCLWALTDEQEFTGPRGRRRTRLELWEPLEPRPRGGTQHEEPVPPGFCWGPLSYPTRGAPPHPGKHPSPSPGVPQPQFPSQSSQHLVTHPPCAQDRGRCHVLALETVCTCGGWQGVGALSCGGWQGVGALCLRTDNPRKRILMFREVR